MNRNRVVFFAYLCVLCGYAFPQEWKTVADGVEYAQVRREFGGKPVDINLLRLDLKKVRLDVHHAMDMAIGTEKTSSIATRHGAFAAINAGFFRLDRSEFAGDSVGALMVDRKLYSEAFGMRVALGISNKKNRTQVSIGHLGHIIHLRTEGLPIPLWGVNRERTSESDVIVYFREFGSVTPVGADLFETVVSGSRVVSSNRTGGGSKIPKDGYVVSTKGTAGAQLWFDRLQPGSYVRFEANENTVLVHVGHSDTTKSFLVFPEDIVSGVPQLIELGSIRITWEQEKASKSFVETRHPRTAVAKLKDGKFLMLTADGRTDKSAGLDLYDLAKYMLELGAVDAMNLDGGGSTTMFLDGKVVNRPSDKDGERKVGDAILVTLRKKKK